MYDNNNQKLDKGSRMRVVFTVSIYLLLSSLLYAQPLVSGEKDSERFTLVDGKTVPIYLGEGEYAGVVRAAGNFAKDVREVSGKFPEVITGEKPLSPYVVLAGTLGRNPWIDRLVNEGKLRVNDIAGKWETSFIQVVDHPFEGVE